MTLMIEKDTPKFCPFKSIYMDIVVVFHKAPEAVPGLVCAT